VRLRALAARPGHPRQYRRRHALGRAGCQIGAMNRRFEEFFAIDPEEVLSKPLAEFLPRMESIFEDAGTVAGMMLGWMTPAESAPWWLTSAGL